MTDLDTLENQNTDTSEQPIEDTVTTEDSNVVTDNTESSATNIDSMSDEEFEAFMNNSTSTTTDEVEDKKEEVTTEKEQTTTPEVKEDSEVKEDTKESTKEDSKVPEEYASIFKPFKANGKVITPKTVEDVISLMQMGANYTKKMQLMAPMKKVVQSLDNAKIDEQELNFLIDVSKGDKEAIKQLLIKHKIDPLEIDLDGDNTYSPRNNIASDEDVEFNDTLMDIHDSLPRIQEILNKTWDDNSKKAILKDPRLMRALHEEVQMGRFDEVQKRLEAEKTFGRYKGISDVDAYIDLVSKMEQERMKTKTQPETPTRTESTKKIPDKSKAAPTKGKTSKSSSSLTAKDLLSMSDDEFNKLSERDLV